MPETMVLRRATQAWAGKMGVDMSLTFAHVEAWGPPDTFLSGFRLLWVSGNAFAVGAVPDHPLLGSWPLHVPTRWGGVPDRCTENKGDALIAQWSHSACLEPRGTRGCYLMGVPSATTESSHSIPAGTETGVDNSSRVCCVETPKPGSLLRAF